MKEKGDVGMRLGPPDGFLKRLIFFLSFSPGALSVMVLCFRSYRKIYGSDEHVLEAMATGIGKYLICTETLDFLFNVGCFFKMGVSLKGLHFTVNGKLKVDFRIKEHDSIDLFEYV